MLERLEEIEKIVMLEVDFVEVIKIFSTGLACGIIFITMIFVLSIFILSFFDIVKK